MDEGATLEMWCGATHRGFESLSLRHTKNALPARGAFFILAPVEVLAKSRSFLRRFSLKIAPNPLRRAQRSSSCKLARITLPRVDATRACCALRRFAPCRIPPCPPQLQRRRISPPFFCAQKMANEAVRLRFMPRQRRFITRRVASYGEAVLHSPA